MCCSQEETIKLRVQRSFKKALWVLPRARSVRYFLSGFCSIMGRQHRRAKASLLQIRAQVRRGRHEGVSGFSPFPPSCSPLSLLLRSLLWGASGVPHGSTPLPTHLGKPRQAFSGQVGDDTLLGMWVVLCLELVKSHCANQHLPAWLC